MLTCLDEQQAKARSTGENNHGISWGKTAVEMALMRTAALSKAPERVRACVASFFKMDVGGVWMGRGVMDGLTRRVSFHVCVICGALRLQTQSIDGAIRFGRTVYPYVHTRSPLMASLNHSNTTWTGHAAADGEAGADARGQEAGAQVRVLRRGLEVLSLVARCLLGTC